MIRERYRKTAALYVASDLLATIAAFFAAWYLRFEVSVLPYTHLPEFQSYLFLLPLIAVIWPLVFYFHGLYQIRRRKGRIDEALTFGIALLLASVILSFAITWVRPGAYVRPDGSSEIITYSRAFLALFALLNLPFLVIVRTMLRNVLRTMRLRSHNLQNILVLGAGALGHEVVRKIQGHVEFGFHVLGFLDDDPGKVGQKFSEVPVLGPLDKLEAVLAQQRVDQVYLALPVEAHKKVMSVLQILGRECVEVRLVPDILQYATLKAAFEDLDGTPVINLSQVPLQGWNSMVKRGVDVALASVALIGLTPIFPLVALAIWLEDHGPIFYRQERMGLDGKSFQIVKLRSMRVNAESSSGPVWAVRDDPRRTRIGGFLRRWSMDELPQIWNVFKGDMSIVGPRPERPAFVNEFKHHIPQYMLRHRVKAGITGWAQVHGWRGNTSIRKRLQYDLYYIENWSLLLDLKILWMTLRYGFRFNAY